MASNANGAGVRLEIERRADGWWIVERNGTGLPDMGPYRTRAEADDDRVGVAKFCRRNPAYVGP